MQFRIGTRQVQVEDPVIVLVLLCLAWAIYYYFSTIAQPDGGPESVLLIKPLLIILAFSALFVIHSAIRITPADQGIERSGDRGILQSQRLVFVISLFVYAAALPYFGYLLPSLIYLIGMSFFLGLRNFWLLLALMAGYTALLRICFKSLMEIPIPIWPTFI